MKHIFTLGLWAVSILALHAQDDLVNKVKNNGSGSGTGFQFQSVINLEATPVKNQGSSGTCWSYSTTGFLESELIRMGKEPIDLSEMYTVRMVYLAKAEKFIRLHGDMPYGQGGALPDKMWVIKAYGAMPQEAYTGLKEGQTKNQHNALEAAIKSFLEAVVSAPEGKIDPSWRIALEGILDAYLGPCPKEFDYKGKRYTPRTFADKVLGIQPDDYVQLTSFIHQPMYERVVVEVPDNWSWGPSYNVPLPELMAFVEYALQEGYTLSWATDVSEKGFSLKNGLALVPAKPWNDMTDAERESLFQGPGAELLITPELRQKAYDSWETTDDHGMQITGIVKDQSGKKYFVVKNSWGEIANPNSPAGYIYASEAFVAYKTISIVAHKKAIPKGTAKKLGF
jgi:bleomycin hydrolase